MAVSYDLLTREFSDVVTLGPARRDHHYGPVIWADEDEYLHVLFGCHRTPGTHLISRRPGRMGSSLDSWNTAAQIAPGISYPDQADAKCRIWDTKGRGAGVPPTIALDEDGQAVFLHVLSKETLDDHRYYYVRWSGGRWKQTPITHSNHQWNSVHLARGR